VAWTAPPVGHSDRSGNEVLHRDFGIDFGKVQEWRKSQVSGAAPDDQAVPDSHAGIAAMEQLDCYFRVTALNRQIAALERQAALGGPDDATQSLLQKQRALREALLDIYRDQAKSIYR
jgi:hypothetical protein